MAESIRAHPQHHETPIVALTSGPRQGDAERCRRLRISRQISKPIKQSELMAMLVDILGGDQSEVETFVESPTIVAPMTNRLQVLLAEDNPINQQLAVGVLERLGHEVTVAATGAEALRLLNLGSFDVILMDVQMPEMDGYEATRRVRAGEEGTDQHVPIIAMTARAMASDREECLSAGMDDFLPKPVRANELSAKLAAVTGHTGDTAVASAESGTAATPNQIDWQPVLHNLHGNRGLLAEVIATLIKEAPGLLNQLCAAVEAQDAQRISNRAHSLKGSVMFLDALSVIEPAEQLESLAAAGQLTDVPYLLDTVEEAMGKLLKARDSNPFI